MNTKNMLGFIAIGLIVILLAGLPLFGNILSNILFPPNQTSPPLWMIMIIAVILIIIFKNYKK